MKNIFTMIFIITIAVVMTSCSGNSGSSAQQNDSVKIEQQRQDSIREVKEKEEAERIKKEQELKEEQERIEAVRLQKEQEEQARLEEEQRQQEEQARREEEQRQKELKARGPEWLQGSWELTINGPYGPMYSFQLTIDGQNARLIKNGKREYSGRFYIEDDYLNVGDYQYRINEKYQSLNYAQYSWDKVGGSSSYQVSSARTASFRTSSDVMSYLSGRTFYNGSAGLRIDYSAVYVNGTALTGAPRVTNISGTSATIVANSPYTGGGTFHFYVNASNGTVTQNGDVYRSR